MEKLYKSLRIKTKIAPPTGGKRKEYETPFASLVVSLRGLERSFAKLTLAPPLRDH